MKRIEELDFLRVIAMMAVMAIHVTSTYIGYESRVLILGMNLAFILNQAARFAVPLFLLLSGLSLGLSEKSDGFWAFWKKRLIKIGLPYLGWTAVYTLWNHRASLGDVSVPAMLRAVFLGQAAPHLYFIVILFQCYLLFPFLKRCIRKAPCSCVLLAFMVTYGVQKLYDFRRLGVDLIPRVLQPYLWLLFPTWSFYFVLGLSLSERPLAQIRKFAAEYAWAVGLAAGFCSALYVVESRVTGDLESIKPALMLYVPLVFLAGCALWRWVQTIPAAQGVVQTLSKHSMTVYFLHVLVLELLRRFPVFRKGMGGHGVPAGGGVCLIPPGGGGFGWDRLTPQEAVSFQETAVKKAPGGGLPGRTAAVLRPVSSAAAGCLRNGGHCAFF